MLESKKCPVCSYTMMHEGKEPFGLDRALQDVWSCTNTKCGYSCWSVPAKGPLRSDEQVRRERE